MNMRIINTLLAGVLMMNVTNAAQITDLSERDWEVTGDAALTYDNSTGLEWLDLTQTTWNSLLMTEAESFFGEFRWATNSEVNALLESVLPGVGYRMVTSSTIENIQVIETARRFGELLGITGDYSSMQYTHGMTRGIGLTHEADVATVAWSTSGNYAYVQESPEGWYETTVGDRGSWLVRDTVNVPAPTTLAIFALGLMGLASRRFKKKS